MMRIVLAQLNPIVGDLAGNTQKILDAIAHAKKNKVDLVVFPELSLLGYPPEDLLLLPHLVNAYIGQLPKIISETQGIAVVIGTIRHNLDQSEKPIYNTAAVISDGKLLGYQDKSLLPTYDVFDERRYFEPGLGFTLFEVCGKKVAVTICEDIWRHGDLLKETHYHRDPVKELAALEPDLVVNLSASPYSVPKLAKRFSVCSKAAKTLGCSLLLCNQVGGNDSLIFDGHSLGVDEKGELIACGKGFQEDFVLIDLAAKKTEKLPSDTLKDLHDALVLGIRDYFYKSGFKKACLGLSGGIDSAVVACLAVDALGKDNVIAAAMPSRYSSEGSVEDAKKLAEHLGIELLQIPIEGPFDAYLQLLNPVFKGKAQDVTEENMQARIRGMLLMSLSNKFGYIVLSTGNKSELALGYSTLYGDMCGGLAVISDLTKRQVYALAHWYNREGEVVPKSTIEKAPSAELRPNQKDSDTLPDYEIVDNVVQGYIEECMSPEDICKKWGYPKDIVDGLIVRIHANEYKRRQSPPGLRVTEKSFSTGRRFPIVQRWS